MNILEEKRQQCREDMEYFSNKNPGNAIKCGEVIGFFGDVIKFSPDAQLSWIKTDTEQLLTFVRRHQNEVHFMIMFTSIDRSGIKSMVQKILAINPDTKFKQINNMKEFERYLNTGSGEIDRELWPLKSIEMLNVRVEYVSIKNKPPVTVILSEPLTELQKPARRYLKKDEIGYREARQISENLDKMMKMKPEEFVEHVGIQNADLNNSQTIQHIKILKLTLHRSYNQQVVFSMGTTVIENMDVIVPGRKIGEGVADAVEMVHGLVGDEDGRPVIEYDCKTLENCQIKGVYLEK